MLHQQNAFASDPDIFSKTDGFSSSTRPNKSQFKGTIELERNGGCQANKPFDPEIKIRVLPQQVDFDRDINQYQYAAIVDERLKRWIYANKIYTYWIPEQHISGGHSIVTGLSFDVDVARFVKSINKGGNLLCGYFSDVSFTIQLFSKVWISERISKDNCRYDAYIEHMKLHNELDNTVLGEKIKQLQNGEIQEMIAYAEGDGFVLDKKWDLTPLQRRQTGMIGEVFGAYVESIARMAKARADQMDISDVDLELKTRLKACPKID